MTAVLSGTRHKVLVIDDELGPRESLRILLKNEYEVLCVDSVADGIRALREFDPDVIVMDIRMPGKTGIEGLKEIREISRHVSVIMMTGYAALETAQEALRLGANDYLKKPFDTVEMRKVIEANVRRAQIEKKRADAVRELTELNSRIRGELATKEHLASLGQASAEFVHDIRNPLCVVHGYIGLLARQLQISKDKLGEEAAGSLEYLNIISKNIQRCNEMVEMWRSLGRRDPQRLGPVSVPALLRDIVGGVRAVVDNGRVAVGMDIDQEDCEVIGDELQIFRAVQNVVNNAIQSINGKGGGMLVSCSGMGGWVEVRVEDEGCGMSAEQAQHLFEPYYTTKAPGKGMGLGLFITKKVIEDHGGTITVRSQTGKGTVVTMLFPRTATAGAPGSQAAVATAAKP